MTDHPTWLFDSTCVLCDGAVQFTLLHEKTASIHFVSIQSKAGRKLARDHGIDPDDPISFLFMEAGVAHTKSDGVIALARHLNGIARLIPLCRFVPRYMRDFAYDIIARNRYRIWGKTDTCITPNPEVRKRFTL